VSFKYVRSISQYAFHSGGQAVCGDTRKDQIPRADLFPSKFLEMVAQNLLNEGRAGAGRADLLVNLQPQVSRNRNGNSLLHAASMEPIDNVIGEIGIPSGAKAQNHFG
jgi:hypothetical protein